MKTVAFCRVSTSLQEYERQINELSGLAQKNGWTVEATFAEKISGAKKNTERKELMKMVDYVKLLPGKLTRAFIMQHSHI